MHHAMNTVHSDRILVVDDQPANLQVLFDLLTRQGYQVRPAMTGELAIKSAQAEPPDLILLDIRLPDMDGYDVCRQLKADSRTCEIPILFLSILDETFDKVKGFQAGAVDYITKPFQPEEVLARVTTHLSLHRLQQDLRELNRTLEDKVAARTTELAKANRAYRALSECNQVLLRATGEPNLLHEICQIIHQECGYRLVWIGLAEQDDVKTVRPVAQAGYEEGYLETVKMSWAEDEWGQGPTGAAIRTGKPIVNREILTNPAYASWREEALKRGYASSAAMPLATGDRVLGALNVYAAEPDAFAPEEVTLLTEIAQDLAYGLTSLRMRVEREQAEEALWESEARYRRLFENSPISLWEEDFSDGKAYFDRLRASGVTDFRAYFEQHPEAVAHCAGLVKILDVNHATLVLLHARNKEELLAGLPQVFTAESLAVFREELITLAEGRYHFASEAVHGTLTGECLTVVLQLSVVPGYEQTLARVLISLQDITDRKQAEEELQQHREHLEELVAERTEALEQEIVERKHIEQALQKAKNEADAANRAKSTFLANMSHELRTPLNAILGFAQLLQREADLTPVRKEKLDAILRSGEHLLKLINDVLALSKIEAGRMTLHLTPVDLWHLLATLEDMLRERAQQKGLQFTIIRAPDVSRYIQADETKLRQVLINLLGNAIKFTEQGSVTLEVTTVTTVTTVEEFPSWEGVGVGSQSSIVNLQFSISDTGIGIVQEELDAIFQPFIQSEYINQHHEGTGLGLTISRAFVGLMGGELRATSAVGTGSCFAFEIPVELVEASTLQPVHAPRRVIGLAPNQPTYRLLVVDDDPDNRTFLTELLGSVGFDVHEAVNGVEAFAQYVCFQPHLIWMDIQLPIMNGYDTTELIREYEGHPASLYPQTVIIALTGHVFEEERAKILAAGCDDVLRKPIKEADIFETLHRRLGVTFLYAGGGEEIGEQQAASRLTPDALATLPADLLDALEQAVIRGNRSDIEEILDALRPQYAPVVDMVARLVKEFKYKEIWSMIQKINQS